jgi:L-iditol 2-dehydrogenase
MKAAITDGKGKVWIDDVPRPEPGDYECLCKTMACATCTGTDTKHIHDKLPWAQVYPGLLGHESVGVVVEAGKKVRNYRIGDIVLRPAAAFPGTQFAGYTSMWGGFAEYGLACDAAAMRADDPEAKPNGYTKFQQVIPADAGISFVDATMLITLKECASYVATSGVGFLSRVLVLGAGSVGISMIRFAKIYGAEVIAVARRDEQLAYARDVIGADEVINVTKQDLLGTVADLTAGKGVDRIIDTSGSTDFLKTALPALAEGGKVGAYATYTRGKARADIVPPELEAGGATGEDIAHPYLLDAVKLGLVTLSDFYSHVMPLDELPKAFEMIASKEAFKVVATMEEV